MPDPSIHPDHAERIERECAEARKQAYEQATATLRMGIQRHMKGASTCADRSTEAWCEEHIRLNRLMLAALEADSARVPMVASMKAAADDLLGGYTDDPGKLDAFRHGMATMIRVAGEAG